MCVYVCVWMCVNVRAYVCMCAHTHAHACVCTHVRLYIACLCVWVSVCTCRHMYLGTLYAAQTNPTRPTSVYSQAGGPYCQPGTLFFPFIRPRPMAVTWISVSTIHSGLAQEGKTHPPLATSSKPAPLPSTWYWSWKLITVFPRHGTWLACIPLSKLNQWEQCRPGKAARKKKGRRRGRCGAGTTALQRICWNWLYFSTLSCESELAASLWLCGKNKIAVMKWTVSV